MTDTLVEIPKKEQELQQEEKTLGIEFECQAKIANNVECYGMECTAHIITQHFAACRKDTNNVLKICKAHEEHFNKLGVRAWFEFVKQHYPNKFNYMKQQYNLAERQLKRAEFVIKEYSVFNEVASLPF